MCARGFLQALGILGGPRRGAELAPRWLAQTQNPLVPRTLSPFGYRGFFPWRSSLPQRYPSLNKDAGPTWDDGSTKVSYSLSYKIPNTASCRHPFSQGLPNMCRQAPLPGRLRFNLHIEVSLQTTQRIYSWKNYPQQPLTKVPFALGPYHS